MSADSARIREFAPITDADSVSAAPHPAIANTTAATHRQWRFMARPPFFSIGRSSMEHAALTTSDTESGLRFGKMTHGAATVYRTGRSFAMRPLRRPRISGREGGNMEK